MYINVEKFAGPGNYERSAEMRVMIKDGPTLYQWVHFQGPAFLGSGDKAPASGWFTTHKSPPVTSAAVKPTELHAAPGTPTSGAITLEGTIGCAPEGTTPDGALPVFP
jgi:hypothetical protein